jgi:hypothetical protein
MQSLLCAGSIWCRIQQPSLRVQPNAAPDQPPTSMSFMFSVLNTYVCVFEDFKNCVSHLCLCWILMSELETYETCLCWVLVLNTYVCDVYLCLCCLFMFVMIFVMYICDIYMLYLLFVWMEYKKQIKKVHTGHFAECYTRQRGSLPSVKTIALGKEPRPGHRYRFFAECNVSDTRQRITLCRVSYVALGKEPNMRTLLGGFFAECRWADTRQRRRLRHPSP